MLAGKTVLLKWPDIPNRPARVIKHVAAMPTASAQLRCAAALQVLLLRLADWPAG